MGEFSEYRGRELRSADGIANRIILTRQYPGKQLISFLIVEGEKDKKVYEWFTDKNACRVSVAYSKKTAIEVLSILEKDNFPGVLALVDVDFDVLEGRRYPSPNLLFTDGHDLEVMIVNSPALDKFLAEYGSEGKIAAFIQKAGKPLRLLLAESSLPIGYLRWISLREDLSLKFEDLDFDKFVDKDTLSVDVAKLIRQVQALTGNAGGDPARRRNATDSDISNSMKQLMHDSHDYSHVCCGHDLVCILAISLRKVLGTHNANDVKPELVEKPLRLAFERSHFERTELYAAIKRWEAANTPFVVLHNEPQ